MEAAITGLANALAAQGLPGIFIAVLLYALYRVHTLYAESQEKRIEESTKTVQAMQSMTSSFERLRDIITATKTGG